MGAARTDRGWALSPLATVTALMYGVGGVGLLLSATFYTEGKNARWLLATLGVVALVFVVTAVARGRWFTVVEAELMLVVLLVSVTVLTAGSHLDVAAFSNGTPLPLIAAYVGWFLPRRAALVFYAGVVSWLLAMAWRGDTLLLSIAAATAVEAVIGCEVGRWVVGRMLRLMQTDSLTGVLNRLAVHDAGSRLVATAERRGTPLSLAVIDLDDLRVVNNTYGHAAGDLLLATAAQRWSEGLPEATVGRIGGDEFVILMPGLTGPEAERRLAALADRPARWSAGVAQQRPGETFESLVERADRLMYNQKGSNAAARSDGGLDR